jgi:Zn-finger nucleic acid-binding protein
MVKCPRCSQDMDSVDIGEIRLDVCTSCRGIWFDADELGRVVSMDAMTLSALPFYGDLQAAADDSAWEHPPAFCPRCSSALTAERLDKDLSVIVDLCPNEHGFWLDQGELHRIKEFLVDATHVEEEVEDMDPEKITRMMEKHRKSLKRFRITYGVPESSSDHPPGPSRHIF